MRMNAQQAVANVEARESNSGNFKKLGFFSLKEKESKRVIPLFSKAEDTEFFSVHQVKMISANGKEYTIDVDCLGTDCPLCKEAVKYKDIQYPAKPQISRKSDAIYMPLVSVVLNDEGKYEFEFLPWKRYSTFYKNTLYPFYMRYAGVKMLEIERADKKTYNLYEARSDEKGNPYPEFNIEEIKKELNIESDDIYGRSDSLAKPWTKAQMETYIMNPNTYPPAESSTQSDVPAPTDDDAPEQPAEEETTRRRGKHNF